MLYNPPSGATNPNASYIGKNVAGGIQGSRVPKSAVEHPQREIVNLIEACDLTPSASNLNQLAEAVQSGQVNSVVVTGTNALSGSLDPAPAVLQTNMQLLVWCPNANTGAITLSLNGGAAETVGRRTGGEFQAGDIPAGGFYILLARRPGFWRCLLPVASELIDQFINTPGSQAKLNPKLMVVSRVRSAMASPGGLTTSFEPWPLNTVVDNQIPGASLGVGPTYRVTLPAGTYRIHGFGMAAGAGAHQARIYDHTAGAVIALGATGDSFPQGVAGGSATCNPSIVDAGRVTFSVTTQITLDHVDYETTAGSFGDNSNFGEKTDAILYITQEVGTP